MKYVKRILFWSILLILFAVVGIASTSVYLIVDAKMKFDLGLRDEGIASLQKNYDLHVWLEENFQKVGINLPFIRTHDEMLGISKSKFMEDFTDETSVYESGARVKDLKITKVKELGDQYFYFEYVRTLEKENGKIEVEKGYVKYRYGTLVSRGPLQ